MSIETLIPRQAQVSFDQKEWIPKLQQRAKMSQKLLDGLRASLYFFITLIVVGVGLYLFQNMSEKRPMVRINAPVLTAQTTPAPPATQRRTKCPTGAGPYQLFTRFSPGGFEIETNLSKRRCTCLLAARRHKRPVSSKVCEHGSTAAKSTWTTVVEVSQEP